MTFIKNLGSRLKITKPMFRFHPLTLVLYLVLLNYVLLEIKEIISYKPCDKCKKRETYKTEMKEGTFPAQLHKVFFLATVPYWNEIYRNSCTLYIYVLRLCLQNISMYFHLLLF